MTQPGSPLKLLGLIGGISAESTAHYYAMLNAMARERLGGRHAARLLLWSVDFGPVADMQEADRWDELTTMMVDSAKRLEGAGAEAIMICANTMHLMADEVAAAVSAPFIHIADATAAMLKAQGASKPVIVATRFTMEKPFYAERLAQHGITSCVPPADERAELHAIIYDELVKGQFLEPSRQRLKQIVSNALERGADSVILGCTEFGMLAPPETFDCVAVDSAYAHAKAAMDFALT